MKHSLKITLIAACLIFSAQYAFAIPINIITNGDFETGDLTGWYQFTPTSPAEWGVESGTVGGESIHSSDYSYFATPWTYGPNPSPVGIRQTVDISSYIDQLAAQTLQVNADLIYSNDGIKAIVNFISPTNVLLSSTPFGEYKGSSASNQIIDTTLAIPDNTKYAQFSVLGYVHAGSYADSGVDNVALTLDVAAIPEPATLGLLGTGLLGLFFRRKK